jgi:hypothetical protein
MILVAVADFDASTVPGESGSVPAVLTAGLLDARIAGQIKKSFGYSPRSVRCGASTDITNGARVPCVITLANGRSHSFVAAVTGSSPSFSVVLSLADSEPASSSINTATSTTATSSAATTATTTTSSTATSTATNTTPTSVSSNASSLPEPGVAQDAWVPCTVSPQQDRYSVTTYSPGCGLAAEVAHDVLANGISAGDVMVTNADTSYTLSCVSQFSGEAIECSSGGHPWVLFYFDSAYD